jgi:transposase
MRGRLLHIDWNPEDTPEALHEAYRAATDPLVKPRLHALWLLRTGKRMAEVAPLLGFVYRTIQKWLAHYRQHGRAGLTCTPRRPNPPAGHLTPSQWEAVRAHLRAGTTRTIDPLRKWMQREFGVVWSYNGLRKALKRERIRLKVPRPRHEKTDRAVQAAWKKGGSPATSRRR